MRNINLHIYPSNMLNESRIYKEAEFISKNMNFEKIILFGVMEKGLEKIENFKDNIYIYRISLFGIENRIISYLYYYFYLFIYIFVNRPIMINIHTLEFLPLSFFARILKIKIIYDAHEFETEKVNLKGFRKKISKIIEKIFIRFVDKVIVVGYAIADEYKKMYPKMDRPFVVLNAPKYKITVKNNLFREKFNIDKNKIIFLYQGALVPNRGIEFLLDVFRSSDKIIVFMGEGSLKNVIKEYSLKYNNIFFHKSVNIDILLDYTSSADVGFCLIENSCKSYDYCMPNKMFEYLMAGIPVVVNKLYELERFIRNNHTGIVIEDEKNIFHILDNLNIEKLKEYKEHIEKVKLEYNWENQERILYKVYEDLIK